MSCISVEMIVAVGCSLLQSVAVCCSVIRMSCISVDMSACAIKRERARECACVRGRERERERKRIERQRVYFHEEMSLCVAACYSVLQCVAVCCGVLQCVDSVCISVP